MTNDLDRNIYTIRYNSLNLPDTIQFKDGHQIINLYNASGRKLSTRNYTILIRSEVPMVNSLQQGQVLDLNYNMDIIDETGTFYVDNIEYDYNGCDTGVYMLRNVYNTEGYANQLNSISGTKYQYYRKDHLGNNREVWCANTNTTLQRTQYYPSGLPWRTTTGIGAGVQNRKYNDKEFVEMHGLDEYDSEARWYYPAIMRTTTMDPLAEKYYEISPYAWCGNNPVRMVDPTGMYIVGTDGKPVTYDSENGFSANASSDTQLIGNAMMQTPEGKTVFENMLAIKDYGITLNYKEGFSSENPNKLGEASIDFDKKTGKIIGVTINLFDGRLQKEVNLYQRVKNKTARTKENASERTKILSIQVPSLYERIGQVGAHEGTHATNPNAMSELVGKTAAEKVALEVEMKTILQTTEYCRVSRKGISPIAVDPINVNPHILK